MHNCENFRRWVIEKRQSTSYLFKEKARKERCRKCVIWINSWTNYFFQFMPHDKDFYNKFEPLIEKSIKGIK